MNCKNCGKYIPDERTSCPNCGVRVNANEKSQTETLLEQILEEQERQSKYLKSISTCTAVLALITLAQIALSLLVTNII